MSLFDEIRAAAARVASDAQFVHIEPEGVRRVAERLAREDFPATFDDPAHWRAADPATTLAFVVTVDAVNFGSGWFPVLDKLPGRSGYMTISTRLREHFEREGPFAPEALARLDVDDCTRIFGQRPENREARELMSLFARALRDLGDFLLARGMQGFEDLVVDAGGSAERLVRALAEMPFYRDVSRLRGHEVPLYKRAQITPADIALAFEGKGLGAFADLDRLTMFPDNLVPHVLRCEGALRYARALLARIDAGELLAPGSTEEVEIRAVGLHAVEEICAHLATLGRPLPARRVDQLLWNHGQRPEIKQHPRHRARSVYY